MLPAISVSEQRLLASGLFLFLVGLLQGVAVPLFASPRLALSAHIAAVSNGLVLVVFSFVWPRIRLAELWGRIAIATIIAGMYGIWVSFSIASIAGAASVFSFAGKGQIDNVMIDFVVTAVVYFGSAASIAGAALFLLGAIRRKP